MRNIGLKVTSVQVATTIADALVEDYQVNNWKVLRGFPEVAVQDRDTCFLVTLKAEGCESSVLLLDRGVIRSQAALREETRSSTQPFMAALQDKLLELEQAVDKGREVEGND